MATADPFVLYDSKEYHLARASFEELSRTVEDENVRLDYLFNAASCQASQGDFAKALEILNGLTADREFRYDLLYNKALCYYRMSNFELALKEINKLLMSCHEKYPELSITSNLTIVDDDDDRQTRLQQLLQNSCLVEGINLKSAILYKLNSGDPQESLSCLNRLPFIKNQQQLDCVTLHNLAIYESDDINNLNLSLSKLIHLANLTNDEDKFTSLVPPETFKNSILICISNGLLENASKFMATNEKLMRKYMAKEWWHFLDIYLEQQSSNSNAELVYRKLNNLLDQLFIRINDNADQLAGSSSNQKNNMSETNRSNGDDLIDLATIIATQECLILWAGDQHQTLEKLLDKCCLNLPDDGNMMMWNKNKAHNLFMLDTRFSDCAHLYEQLLPQSTSESLNHVDPMVLGNLCVSYVLTGRNGDAEALMKEVEIDEASTMNETDALSSFHNGRNQTTSGGQGSCLSYINIIIGTLYCVKFNYDFGLTRVFKSLLPLEQRLNIRTWFYVKRCILSLLDCHCKQMICIKDDLFQQVVSFLIQCEKCGLLVEANERNETIEQTDNNDNDNLVGQEIHSHFHGQNSVTYEARYLRSIVLTVIHD